MNAALVAGWLAAASPVAACPPEPRMDIAVMAEHQPPAVRSGRSLARLRDAAALAGPKGRHAPLGLYAGVFGYTVEVALHGARAPGCAPAIAVEVRLFLAGRVVEVGSDLHAHGCRPEAVLSHYLVHAEQDDRLLSFYARRALAMFDRLPSSDLLGAPAPGDDVREAVAAGVRRAMDGLLRPYDDDRARAQEAADGDEELARLRGACGRDL